MDNVRKAVAYAERTLDIERLLLRSELCSDAGRLFLERYGELINLSASGQLAMHQVLTAHLKRVTWDDARLPIRLHPFVVGDVPNGDMPIAIDPRITFGRPVVVSQGISTAAIADRIDAGESPADVAADYDLTTGDVKRAVVYERAASASSSSPTAISARCFRRSCATLGSRWNQHESVSGITFDGDSLVFARSRGRAALVPRPEVIAPPRAAD